MVKVNGVFLHIAGKTLAQHLADTDCDGSRVAVELNGQIVPRRLFGETVLKNGDTVEIVSFVGGG